MQNAVTDNVRSLFAVRGIDTASAGHQVELVIDRFDNWSNRQGGQAFGCFTTVCTTAPPLAEAS
ncbi:hypothetical protein SAMN04489729_2977 [Amycolatopsis lurida]|uniref:Uncharacterized protein n=1 Tax=Amycolatopsis lurida NRRL 2430 TaxID=1460371 RepID=A0A2P2FR13_AMYLU|nr:hypothetical protein [Amycolatopsis lurida]KFU79181.1 hypothetical protein BB31_21285 [Amycolatopsis lurida NRRL 2430]SEC97822.1 hypothetical protein SAMN04489729_2977 [Amycolatopsis lurida]